MSVSATARSVAVLEPQPGLRAHFEEVARSAGYRIEAPALADAVVVAVDGPGAFELPEAPSLAVSYGPPQGNGLQRPFSPSDLVHRLDDLLGAAFRGGTSPLARANEPSAPTEEVSAVARRIAAAVPELMAVPEAQRPERVQALLDAADPS